MKIDVNRPIQTFLDCHAGLQTGLKAFEELPDLVAAAERSRSVAKAMLRLFQDEVLPHHADEERELFVAVQRSAQPGPEAQRVAQLIARLTAEHRGIEHSWRDIEAAVRAAASRTRTASLPAAKVSQLVAAYRSHAAFEEGVFLPLAQEILGRDNNHMVALGLALHLRHPPPMPAAYL